VPSRASIDLPGNIELTSVWWLIVGAGDMA
jgi:hypothetical protein